MSTRYVWEQYDYKITEERGTDMSRVPINFSESSQDTEHKNVYLIVCEDYELKFDPNGYLAYYPVGQINAKWKYFQISDVSKPNIVYVSNWPYAILTGPDSSRYGGRLFVADKSGGQEQWCLTSILGSEYYANLEVAKYFNPKYTVREDGTVEITGTTTWFDSRYASSASISKTYKGLKSASNPDSYPQDGIYGSYYYKYSGSDNIDPIAISYANEDLEAGQEIKISITPSESKVYGGTVTYIYDYCRNNDGIWFRLISTTSLSASYTIPEGTTSIQFRVRSSDNIGFTSTDYVTGDNVAVSQLKGYVGINGKARKADRIYVGVNGKARQVVKGYIGVNGKARKFL